MSTKLHRAQAGLLIIILFIALLCPTHQPALSQGNAPQTIESDASQVARAGRWTRQSAASASGGYYLYSSGANTDVLTLAFNGASIEVRYVAGPSLGTLAIEIDDTVLRTVITTATKTAYQQTSRIDYLSNAPHTLKVYAQKGGVIAVDAFVIPTPNATPSPQLASSDGGTTGDTRTAPCTSLSTIHRISENAAGQGGNQESAYPDLSADGRFVTFVSLASNLVVDDSNHLYDAFVYDQQTCDLRAVSINSNGVLGNGNSTDATISDDGRFIAFLSSSTNFVSGDNNGLFDVFVHDRQTATTTRVSVATGGAESNGQAQSPAISADGRYVAFLSSATNLVSGDTNGQQDIFVHDRQTATTTRVSVATGGAQATGGSSTDPAISADGRFVAFVSGATNLVAGDTNGLFDVFVHDRQTTTTTRVSVATGGIQGTGGSSSFPAISADGRYVTFFGTATNLVAGDTNGQQDVFVHDRQTTTTTRVSVATGGAQATGGGSSQPAISADGRYVTFMSFATNLVAGDTNALQDVFVHDRQTATTTRVSLSVSGTQATGFSSISTNISADGRIIAFHSQATNLVPSDTNSTPDVFVTPWSARGSDTLAIFNPPFNYVSLLNTLADNPPYTAYTAYSAYAPINGGQWVMGDWNGDGLDTPGIYNNGPFYYTNKSGESQPSDWQALWIGIAGPPVAGRFNASLPNDCIGAVQAGSFPPFGTAFVFYFTCDLSGNTAPAISFQWLSAVLPDSGGFSGTHQFGAGDFNADGVDSIAVRRGTYIAFGNVPPTTNSAAFDLAQFIGAPSANDAGTFVVGNWDGDPYDSFGLFYQNGEFFFRNDLSFNTGVYGNQSVGTPFGNAGVQVASWH